MSAWRCPFQRSCFETTSPVYPSRQRANEAVERYQARSASSDGDRLAHELYHRHLPVVTKALARFCPESRCYAGACVVEELVGETYPIFKRALVEYEPGRGVDFLGYVSQRLDWGLRQRARPLRRQRTTVSISVSRGSARGEIDVETCLLDRLHVYELLARLRPDEAQLLARRYAEGYSGRELAAAIGVSHAAVRKRLQRIRTRTREPNR